MLEIQEQKREITFIHGNFIYPHQGWGHYINFLSFFAPFLLNIETLLTSVILNAQPVSA